MPKLALAKTVFKNSWIIFALIFLLLVISAYYLLNQSKRSQDLANPQIPPLPQTLTNSNLAEFAKLYGVEKTYLQLKEKFPANDTTAHDFAHVIGIVANDTKAMEGLKVCDTAYNYGCYHGFIEAFFAANTVDKVTMIESSCIALGPVHAPSCLHGIGHGVLVNRSYNLDQALSDCSTYLQQSSQIYCFDGTFMERITGSMLKADRKAQVTQQNLNEPCMRVDYIFKNQCWRNQVSVWNSFYKGDSKKVGVHCAAIESEFQKTCFESIGLSTVMSTPEDSKIIASRCRIAPQDQISEDCLSGAIKEIMFEGKDPSLAQSLCEFSKNQQDCQTLFNTLLVEYHQRFNR